MVTLGDHFPPELLNQFVDRALQPGSILYLFCEFTTPPKHKYLVFLHRDQRPLFFLINSRVHPYIQGRPHLAQSQVLLSASTYDFLDHDSYLDCSTVRNELTLEEMREQLSADLTFYRGDLDEATRQTIVRVVGLAPTIAPLHKNLIITSLSS